MRSRSTEPAGKAGGRTAMEGSMVQRSVVAVKSVTGAVTQERWCSDKLLPGDIVEQLRVVDNIVLLAQAPFPGGKAGLQSELREIYNAGTRVLVKVRRGRRNNHGTVTVELQACVVAEESVMRKKHYSLADACDKSRVVVLMDATEEKCISLQNETQKILEEVMRSRVANAQLKDCLVPYSWQKKMETFLPCPNSSMVFSLLVMPFQPNRLAPEVNDLEETSARAMAWLSSAQSSGVPVTFVNIQVEPILQQDSGSSYFGSSSREDPSSLVHVGRYTLQDWQGTDIHIFRAVRLWFAPAAAELPVSLMPTAGETRLGVGISRTEEGFCYISSVDFGTAADRSGLRKFYEAARSAQKLLVISRLAGEKVTPWMVSSSGLLRCFDTHSISEKLSVHRQAQQPILIHVMIWDGAFDRQGCSTEVSMSPRTSFTSESSLAGSSDRHFSSRKPSPKRSESGSNSTFIGHYSQEQVEWNNQSGVNCSQRPSHHSPSKSSSPRVSSQLYQVQANGNIGHCSTFDQPQLDHRKSIIDARRSREIREGPAQIRDELKGNSCENGIYNLIADRKLENRGSHFTYFSSKPMRIHDLSIEEIQPDCEGNKDFSFHS